MRIGLIDLDGKLPRKLWTEEEIELLKKAYKEKIDPSTLMPYRSYGSLTHKASRLGLTWWESSDVCRICGAELGKMNWYESSCFKKDRICKACLIKQSRAKKVENPEETRKWCQQNYLKVKGRSVLCRKRPKPGFCEICGKREAKVYHHWGEVKEGEKVPGIWICHYCHSFAELIDQGFTGTYLSKKEEILNESGAY